MEVRLVWVGKTHKSWLKEGLEEYLGRLKHYTKLKCIEIPDIKNPKNFKADELKKKEGELILPHLQGDAYLLDENGKHFNSLQFSKHIEQLQIQGTKQFTLVIGGAFGFSPEVYQKAKGKIRLSDMTFSHQMIRVFLAEQLYRAFTIINREPYHNA